MRIAFGLAWIAVLACGKSKSSDPPPADPKPDPKKEVKAEPKAEPKPADPCQLSGFTKLDAYGLKLQAEVPADRLRDIMNVKPGVEVSVDRDDKVFTSLQIRPVTAEDDFEKVKAEIDSRVEKYKAKITWQKSETTTDGYRLEYTELGAAKGATLGYNLVLVRTIGGQKYVCSNASSFEAGHTCGIRSCESVKPL
jgi:hypothetical protein